MPQSRESGRLKWTFTWNNYGPSAIQDLLDYARDSANKCDICFFQQETGESGTPHLQGFMQFSVKKRMQTIKNSLSNTIHFEPSRGTIEQNLEYCSKEDTRTGQFYEHWRDESLRPEPEEPLMVIDEEDLYPYQKELEEMYKTERLNAANLWKDKEGGGRQEQQRYNRLIHWVWERDGNVGKTSFAKYMCNNILILLRSTDPLQTLSTELSHCAWSEIDSLDPDFLNWLSGTSSDLSKTMREELESPGKRSKRSRTVSSSPESTSQEW